MGLFGKRKKANEEIADKYMQQAQEQMAQFGLDASKLSQPGGMDEFIREAQAQSAAMAAQAQADAAAQPAAAPDPLDQIERLGELHKAGALTDEEFAAQKARLLEG